MFRAQPGRLASMLVALLLVITLAGRVSARAFRIGSATALGHYPSSVGSIFDPYQVHTMSAASPGKPLVAICGAGLKLFDLHTGRSRQLSKGYDFSPVWSPDGSRLACIEAVNSGGWAAHIRDWQVRVVDINSGSSKVIASAVRIRKLAWTSNTKLAWRNQSDTIAITDVTTGRDLAKLSPADLHVSSLEDIAWSRAGDKVVTAGNDGQGHDLVNLVDLRTGAVRTIARQAVWGISWSPDGKWIALRFAPAYRHPELKPRIEAFPTEGGDTWQIGEPSTSAICWSPRSDGVLIGRSESKGPVTPGMARPTTGELLWAPLRGRPVSVRSLPEGVKAISWTTDHGVIVETYGTVWRLTVDADVH